MSGYFNRRLVTRTSQPQGVVGLDKNHRLYRNLVGVLLPDVPINLVDGAPLLYGSATTRSAGASGKALEVADGAAGGVYFTSPRLTSAMTLMTMVTRVELLSNPGASRRQFICIGDSWNSPYENNVIDFSNDPQLTVNTGFPYGQYPVPLKKPQTIGASFRGAGGTSVWIDGKFDSYSGTATSVRNTQGRAGWLNLSYNTGANRAPPVKGYVALYFDIDLSDADMKDVTANPWQFFEPEEIEEWAPAAGGGTSIAGALGNAAASGFTGTVNANRTIAGALGAATASGFKGVVNANRTIAGTLGVATASGFAGTVGANRGIAGALGTAVASGFNGTVSNTNDMVIGGTLGTAVASGFSGGVAWSRFIAGVLGTAQASGFTGGVQSGDTQDASGGWPMPIRRKKRKPDDEELTPEVVEAVAEAPKERRTITLQQLIGKRAAAQVDAAELSQAIRTLRLKKRQREDEELMLM